MEPCLVKFGLLGPVLLFDKRLRNIGPCNDPLRIVYGCDLIMRFCCLSWFSENASGFWAFSEAGVRKNAMQQRALNSDVGMDLYKILIFIDLL
jgi:hypothetical protein